MTVLELIKRLSYLPKDKQVIIHAYDTFNGLVAHVEDISFERAEHYLSDYQQSVLHIDSDYVVVLSGDELEESEE